MAREAKTSFDQGKFKQAEKQYQDILAKSPNNVYSLSNLGVVLFRNGKLKAAELTLKKAIALAPGDEFTDTTLGIVYYQQSKFDDALSELTKSLAINPKSATAHNYLGITASQKGWQEAAEKEMLEAIAENPELRRRAFQSCGGLLDFAAAGEGISAAPLHQSPRPRRAARSDAGQTPALNVHLTTTHPRGALGRCFRRATFRFHAHSI